MSSTVLWDEFNICLQTVANFSIPLEEGSSCVEGSEKQHHAYSSIAPPPVPNRMIEVWEVCLSTVSNSMKEVDLRLVCSFIPSLQKNPESLDAVSKEQSNLRPPRDHQRTERVVFSSDQKTKEEMLYYAQKRQDILFGSVGFDALQGTFMKWTTFIFIWIFFRVHWIFSHNTESACLTLDEVQRYLHFLHVTGTHIRNFNSPIERRMHSFLESLTICGYSAQLLRNRVPDIARMVHRIESALTSCVDMAYKDPLDIGWDYINPSDLPTIVFDQLSRFGKLWSQVEWLSSMERLRNRERTRYTLPGSYHATWEESYLSNMALRRSSSLKKHQLERLTLPPISVSFSPLKFLFEKGNPILHPENLLRLLNSHSLLLLQFKQTLQKIEYQLLVHLSSHNVEQAYSVIPVFVDFMCALDMLKYLEMLNRRKKMLRNQLKRKKSPVKHLYLTQSSHSFVKSATAAVRSAVCLLYQGFIGTILESYDSKKDAIAVSQGKKNFSISSCAFQLLVEIIEPTLSLLRLYGSKRNTISRDIFPVLYQSLTNSIEFIWKMLVSTTLPVMESLKPTSNKHLTKLWRTDVKLLSSYLKQM